MQISEPLHETLRAVAEVMDVAQDPWWIIGSAAVALHGAVGVTVADVDVLLSANDATRVLAGIGVQIRPGSDHADFRSEIFGTWLAHPLPVEFMAGFCHRRGGEWRAIHPITRQQVLVGNATLYLPAREELRAIIDSFGRPKDQERVWTLDAVIPVP